ncbi:class I SAM-dependent methyltransferase [Roseospira goensis]|uniref:SAM-dependent methyltransferase n=1 Tax=Roseospira goensis TaxID=391922 RepID=A0A7W6WLL8_9PROT|nr:class I SAM-dependent methyltransferase [Roseospira goensis]MBB4286532.1 SAM-dependent methyltransferase [Roseospira goensis]
MSEAAMSPESPHGAGGYVLDTAYLYELYADHSPVHLNAVAAFAGARPRPLEAGTTWCDVGCGNGVSALAIAAALPQVAVIGVDLNPRHIAFARGIAEAAGLTNARFLEGDHAALPAGAVPPLDFAVLHGVLSWVDGPTRERLLDRVLADLKPGGLLMASYDALPGWAAQKVMRDMMVAVTRDVEGGSLGRARAALDWLRRMKAGGATFFRDNPALGRLVDDLRDDQLPYIAHEYLNAGLWPFAFAQVNEALAARGASFVGRTEMFLNIADLAAPEALHDELTGAASRAEFEARRDFVRNEGFRRDVYVKGAGLDDLAAWEAAMDAQRLAVTEPLAGLDRDVAFGGVRVSFTGPPFDAALDYWETHPGHPLPDLPGETAREVARLLLAARLVDPVAPAPGAALPDAAAAARLAGGRLSLPLPFNRVACTRLSAVAPRVPLAAPALGAVVDVGAVDALLLMGLAEAGRSEAPRWTVRAMAAAGREMQHDGRRASDAEAEALLDERLDALQATGRVAKLVQLGILQPAASAPHA